MPRFVRTTQKYDDQGRKVPKGKDGLKKHKDLYPESLIFDSKNEYLTYLQLKKLESENLIHNLQTQVSFELLPSQKWWNNLKQKWEILRKLDYVCDFLYERYDQFGRLEKVCVDCKGWRQQKDKKTGKIKWSCYYDDIYKLKKKLFLQKYPEFIFEER